MITISSDLRLSFEQLGIKFQRILTEHQEELEVLTKKAVESFDFEGVLESHIHSVIQYGIERAFDDVDLSDKFRVEIWNEIEKRLKK